MPKKITNTILRNGVFYLKLKVPKDLRELGAYGGKEQIIESLKTKSYKEANMEAPIRIGRYKEEFATLLQRHAETGSIELPKASKGRRTRIHPTKLFSSTEVCHFLSSPHAPEDLGAQLLQEYFVEHLRDAEDRIEYFGSKAMYEQLEEALSDNRNTAARCGGGMPSDRDDSLEEVSGEKLLVDYLHYKKLHYSREGVEAVSSMHDKFRRASLEVAKRAICRIEQLQSDTPPTTAWLERFDPYFTELSITSTASQPIRTSEHLPVRPQSNSRHGESLTIGRLCQLYLEKQKDIVKPKSYRDDQWVCAMLEGFLGFEFPLEQFNITTAKSVLKFVSEIPSRFSTLDYTSDLKEAVANTPFKPSSEATFNKKCNILKAIFNFAETDYPCDYGHNAFKTSSVTSYRKTVIPKGEARERVEYTTEQLNTLFNLPLYTGHLPSSVGGGWKREGDVIEKNTGRYWAPLIMLFLGCRLNEAAQLMVEDFVLDHEVLHIRVSKFYGGDTTTETPKWLKNKNSERLVPIHSELIKCGLLEFVAEARLSGRVWLFPEWSPDNVADWKVGDPLPPLEDSKKHSEKASRHCLRTRDAFIDENLKPKPDNHSFRHGARTALRIARVPLEEVRGSTGLAEGRQIHVRALRAYAASHAQADHRASAV